MKHAGTIYSGRVSFDPYAMHRAVESIPADILLEIVHNKYDNRAREESRHTEVQPCTPSNQREPNQ